MYKCGYHYVGCVKRVLDGKRREKQQQQQQQQNKKETKQKQNTFLTKFVEFTPLMFELE